MSDQEMTDCESRGLKPRLYGYDEYNQGYPHKYHVLKILSVATVCLLFGLIAGGYVQQFASSIQMPYEPSEADNFGASMSGGRPDRPNEAKCKARRCCRIKDDLSPKDLPPGLNCRQLDDESCGGNDEHCDWDCNPPASDRAKAAKQGRRRTFRGIAAQNGGFKIPKTPDQDAPWPGHDPKYNRYEDCMKEGKLISTDDCGVEYDEELDPDKRELFCKNNPPRSAFEALDVHRRLIVQGSDDREEITSTDYPYSAVMYMEYEITSNQYTYRCTATMISPRWAITSAHCVLGYYNFRFYKKLINGWSSYGWQRTVIFSEFLISSTGDHYDYDIAWVQLDSDPGVGYFNIGFSELSTHPYVQYFNIISYPADKGFTKCWQKCLYKYANEHLFGTDICDTYGGASGSGLYFWDGTWGKIMGIHGHVKGSTNAAVRITTSKYAAIKADVTDNPNLVDVTDDVIKADVENGVK